MFSHYTTHLLVSDYEVLAPRLAQLREKNEEDRILASDLEKRVAEVLQAYATRVRTMTHPSEKYI